MAIDRSNFLLVAGALAAGGVGGWAYRDRAPKASPPVTTTTPAAKPSATPPPGPVPVTVIDASVANAPACDDSRGTPEECPSVGPADEGVCANTILKRCQEFKAAFEPKVAAHAVACLRALKPSDRCDAARINQCGHAALMAACPEPAPPTKAQLQNANGNEPTVTIAPDTTRPASPVAMACESIEKACGGQPSSPTLADCRQTLAGLNDVGRANTVDCVTAHCDRGLYGCEAAPKAVSVASVNGAR